MNDESDSRMVRLPVRDMRDEPAPQRAAQEGDLPPLPEPAFKSGRVSQLPYYTADQMREYARLALAAAGGGVPQNMVAVPRSALEKLQKLTNFNTSALAAHVSQMASEWLASSLQPEAAPAVAQVPDGWKVIHVESKTWGEFIDAMDRAERKGYLPDAVVDEWLAFDYNDPAAAPEAPAQAKANERVTEFNVGRWCLSEDDCIAQGIDFSAYELGVADAAKAFGRNTTETPKVAGEPVAWVNRDELDNMLDDRTATVAGIRSGWRKTPLYLHPPTAQAVAQVPQWKLVPVEPTTAMINAGQCGCMDNDVTVCVYKDMLAAAPEAPAQAEPDRWCPDVCPITGLRFFMWIEHHKTRQMVPTYGGPYDSYTIPVRDDDGSYIRERYDHDRGSWLVDEVEDVGIQIVSDQAFVYEEERPLVGEPAQAAPASRP